MSDALALLRANLELLATPQGVAELFCSLDDDAQAQVFVHIGRIMDGWPRGYCGVAKHTQCYSIGNHLRTCTCSTESAREVVRLIYDAMQTDALERESNSTEVKP